MNITLLNNINFKSKQNYNPTPSRNFKTSTSQLQNSLLHEITLLDYQNKLASIGINAQITPRGALFSNKNDNSDWDEYVLIIKGDYKPSDIQIRQLGIDEDKLFENIVEINGNFDTKESNLTNLGALQAVHGDVYLGTKIRSVGNLKYITSDNGRIEFNCPMLKKLNDYSSYKAKNIILNCANLDSLGKNSNFKGNTLISSRQLSQIVDKSIKDAANLQSLQRTGFLDKTSNYTPQNFALFQGDTYLNCPNLESLFLPIVLGNLKVSSKELRQATLGEVKGDLILDCPNLISLYFNKINNGTFNCPSIKSYQGERIVEGQIANYGSNRSISQQPKKTTATDSSPAKFELQKRQAKREIAMQIAFEAKDGKYDNLINLLNHDYFDEKIESFKIDYNELIMTTVSAIGNLVNGNEKIKTQIYDDVYRILNPENHPEEKEFYQKLIRLLNSNKINK